MVAKIARNLASLGRHPGMVGEYLNWLISSARTGGNPYRRLLDGIEIAGFSNFSEYHSVPGFINAIERRFFEEYPVSDGVIVDVGANVGLVSLLLARRFPDRAIHSFEPNPTTFDALKGNVVRNGSRNVVCHRLAVSDADGTVLFDNDPVARGTASISYNNKNAHSTPVPAVTLDSFIFENRIDKIGLLKVDVEGFEKLVFSGASKVINDIRPAAIYFEVCPALTERAGFSAADPARILMDAGYDLYRFAENGNLIPAKIDDLRGVVLDNWLATHS